MGIMVSEAYEALNYIDKIAAELSRLNQKIAAKLDREIEGAYAFIARGVAAHRRLERDPQSYSEQGPHVYSHRLCTASNGMASIGTGDSVTESTQPSKQTARRRIGFI